MVGPATWRPGDPWTRLNQVVGGETASSTSNQASRRVQLVEAAFRLVAEVGLEGLRLRQVADAVGIDHSTLHHHVATKQDLVNEVAEYATRQFWSTMSAEADPVAALHGHLFTLRTMITQRPELFTVAAELDLRARRDPSVRVVMDRLEAGWRESLRDLLVRGSQSAAWSPAVDVEATIELVIAVVKGARLAPGTSGVVFDQLEALLTAAGAGPSDGRKDP
jgi:TetR/AcrR family transcriptional repressor of nem operon